MTVGLGPDETKDAAIDAEDGSETNQAINADDATEADQTIDADDATETDDTTDRDLRSREVEEESVDGDVPTLDLTGPKDETESSSTGATRGDDENSRNSGESDGSKSAVAAASGESDDEVEPVELLVQLAEEGEIEPWDIDIVHVTDAFLEKLEETDLRTTGRALFYAAVLLRMKSDEMLAVDEPDEPEAEPWEVALEGGAADPADPDFDPIDSLEAEMDRRLDRKNTRGSPETLDELVRELRDAERHSWWKQSREYDTTNSPTGYARGTQTLDYHAGDEFRRDGEPTAGDATERTHDEDIEETIADIESALRAHFDAGRTEVLFVEIETAGGRPFMTFLALLFMAHRGSVRLQQDELFGDLWIRDPSAPSIDAEAVAD